jgi:hypothetical protein
MKYLFITLILASTTVLYSQGKFELGYDNLKWNMTVDQVKILFASDTVVFMTVQYRDGFVMKVNGKLAEHSYQRVHAEIKRTNNNNVTYSCSFIDNSLCGIAIYDLDDATKYAKFDYLHKKNDIGSDIYSKDNAGQKIDDDGMTRRRNLRETGNNAGWRIDSNVMIYLGDDNRKNSYDVVYIFLFRKEWKDVYDQIVMQLERTDNNYSDGCFNIRSRP